jgi:hypothetical protein
MSSIHPRINTLAAFDFPLVRGKTLQLRVESFHDVFGKTVREMKCDMLNVFRALKVGKVSAGVPAEGAALGNATLLSGTLGVVRFATRESGVPEAGVFVHRCARVVAIAYEDCQIEHRAESNSH